MEEHRLKDLPEDYNPQLFNQLYKELIPLKRKLASNFDYSRFKGATYQDLLSFFDIKFIHTYNKYYCVKGLPPNLVRAHLIRALSNYRNRLLKVSYHEENLIKPISSDDVENFDNLFEDKNLKDNRNIYLGLLYSFMQQRLNNPIAYDLFHIELYTPQALLPFVIMVGRNKIIPTWVLCEYLDIPEDQVGIIDMNEYFTKCRIKIKRVLEEAKVYFKDFDFSFF